MESAFRVSVRELVGFTYFPPDIAPMAGVEEMLAGTKAHQAREAAQSQQFEIEKPIRGDVEQSGERVTVFGRMDAFRDGEPPCVEEIKLCHTPPDEAMPEHWAQALLYGALLALQSDVPVVEIQVAYVNAEGMPLRVFTKPEPRDALLETLRALLTPWLAFAVPEREHARCRDASIRDMRFPFAQYRAGQRELAVQVYTAVTRKKRLFASLPTGTGKSAAVLFPALKALGEGKTRQVIYLTARTTARQSPLNALTMLREQGLQARVSTLLAKEKMCPSPTRCHPDDCTRARGHFLRQPAAIQQMLSLDALWTDDVIYAVADEHAICPFEFALALTDIADVVLMDMNYAFDPFAQIARMFKRRKDFTLLVDEAHHLLDRVRESLSGSLDTRELRAMRVAFGKALGRKHPYYRQLGELCKALGELGAGGESMQADSAPPETQNEKPAGNAEPYSDPSPSPAKPRETQLEEPPPTVIDAAQSLCEATFELSQTRQLNAECRQYTVKLIRRLSPFLYAAQHYSERYATLLTASGRQRVLELYCLSPGEAIAAVTKGLRGTVFFSATLAPLPAMRELLGGKDTDACFALPSPFPTQRLAVVRRRIQTRYAYRETSAAQVAQSIAEAVQARAGKYIAYFPSYAYLGLVYRHLSQLPLPPLLVQESEMTEEARNRFLEAFTRDQQPKLGLCVLGGLFSEGVDLPGDQLIGAMIVGVGLPTPSLRLKTLQAYYDARFGDGFLYAWMIPAMQKVSQAGGRVIRTERDTGLVLLLDDRYYDARYTRLLPEQWHLTDESIAMAAKALERLEGI